MNRATVMTDQKPLTWLLILKTANKELQRRSLLLSQFRFKIKHKARILSRNAHAPSQYKKLAVYIRGQITERTKCKQQHTFWFNVLASLFKEEYIGRS